LQKEFITLVEQAKVLYSKGKKRKRRMMNEVGWFSAIIVLTKG
jgi:hypothetical protein